MFSGIEKDFWRRRDLNSQPSDLLNDKLDHRTTVSCYIILILPTLFRNNFSSLKKLFTVIKAKVTFKSEQDHSEGSVFFQLANQTQPIKSLKDKLFLLFNSIWINIFQDAKTVQTVDFTKIPFPSSDFISRFCQDRRWGKLDRFKTRSSKGLGFFNPKLLPFPCYLAGTWRQSRMQ